MVAPSRARMPGAASAGFRADRAGVEQRRVQTGLAARFLFALETDRLLHGRRHVHGPMRFERDLQSPKQRREVEAGPVPGLPRAAGRA